MMADTLLPFPYSPATFSPCRTWRYRLERRWSKGPPVAFILLNPSTADEELNDPTIRRCINYGKRWGYGGLILGNAFAYRSTDPERLAEVDDPIGPDNDEWLLRIATESGGSVVCGWGAYGSFKNRGPEVLAMLRRNNVTPLALKVTAAGHPGHPLYLPGNAQPFLI